MLVDTDILIDYFRGVEAAIVFVESNIDQLTISAITVAELYQGVRDGREREALGDFISAVNVIEVSQEIAMAAGLYRREFRKSHNLGLADCLIAATANLNRSPLRTLNTKHFPMMEDVSAPYSKE